MFIISNLKQVYSNFVTLFVATLPIQQNCYEGFSNLFYNFRMKPIILKLSECGKRNLLFLNGLLEPELVHLCFIFFVVSFLFSLMPLTSNNPQRLFLFHDRLAFSSYWRSNLRRRSQQYLLPSSLSDCSFFVSVGDWFIRLLRISVAGSSALTITGDAGSRFSSPA